jgi:hypothetical protein
MSRRVASFASIVFALIAVLVLVHQPICEAEELHLPGTGGALHVASAQGDRDGPYCSIDAAVAVKAASGGAEKPRAARSHPAPAPLDLHAATLVRLATTSTAPPTVPRYHARSARIQR